MTQMSQSDRTASRFCLKESCCAAAFTRRPGASLITVVIPDQPSGSAMHRVRRRPGNPLHRLARSGLLVAILVAANTTQASAREGDPGAAPLQACRSDSSKYCSDLDRTGGGEAACLRQFYINLSQPCQAALDARGSAGAPPGGDDDDAE